MSDLHQVDGKAELVNGNLVRMPPTGGRPGDAALEIVVSLREHAGKSGFGKADTDNVAFLVQLPNRRSFSLDAAFWTGEPPSMRFYDGAPVFAVEERSETDYGRAAEHQLANKRADYFVAGTQVVWDVDLLGEVVVRAHRSGDNTHPNTFRRGEIADAEPAVPAWRMPVDLMFG